MASGGRTGRRRVAFEVRADANSEVFVAGTFNNWNPAKNRMTYKPETGAYRTALLLEPGRHEYKFVINGVWCVDPECADWVANDLGSLNSVITVG